MTAGARRIGLPAETLDGVPVLEARRIRPKGSQFALLKASCPHCRRYHLHGAGDSPGDGDGHRVAHCHDPSGPYAVTGYYLREVQR